MSKIKLLVITIMFFACGNKKTSNEISHEKMMNFRKSIMTKYSIKYDWYGEEMDKKKMSIEFEEVLNSDKQLVTYFEILDILKKENSSYLLVDLFDYILELEIPEESCSKIIELSKVGDFMHGCVLIVRIDDFGRNKNILSIESLHNDDISGVRFFGKGKLLGVECLAK